MEPIASSGAGAVFRPTAGASSELSGLLRDGRVLGAEVLSSRADGTLLLAIGRHTVPAETALRLDPGTRFLVRVEQTPEGVVLALLSPDGEQEAALLRALRGVVGDQRPPGELFGALARALRAVLGEDRLAPELAALARHLAASLARPTGDAGALRTLLSSLGHGHEASLAALLGARAAPGSKVALEKLRGDQKSLLLAAELALQAGGEERGPARAALHEAVARALTSLEAEQLLNLARERAGDPLVLSFPFPDPSGEDGWATARLCVPSRRERESGGEDDSPFRLTLGLELSRLGPLRADLLLTPALLSLRLVVGETRIARRIEAELAQLRERVGDGRRALELSVRLGTPTEIELGLRPLDIRYLHENHLMNVAG